MSFWKKFGVFLMIFPLIIAFLVFITNVGKSGSYWPIVVVLMIIVSCALSIPGGLLIWIGNRRDQKKNERDDTDSGIEFESFVQ
jgi:hypothetical protein